MFHILSIRHHFYFYDKKYIIIFSNLNYSHAQDLKTSNQVLLIFTPDFLPPPPIITAWIPENIPHLLKLLQVPQQLLEQNQSPSQLKCFMNSLLAIMTSTGTAVRLTPPARPRTSRRPPEQCPPMTRQTLQE